MTGKTDTSTLTERQIYRERTDSDATQSTSPAARAHRRPAEYKRNPGSKSLDVHRQSGFGRSFNSVVCGGRVALTGLRYLDFERRVAGVRVERPAGPLHGPFQTPE